MILLFGTDFKFVSLNKYLHIPMNLIFHFIRWTIFKKRSLTYYRTDGNACIIKTFFKLYKMNWIFFGIFCRKWTRAEISVIFYCDTFSAKILTYCIMSNIEIHFYDIVVACITKCEYIRLGLWASVPNERYLYLHGVENL